MDLMKRYKVYLDHIIYFISTVKENQLIFSQLDEFNIFYQKWKKQTF